MRVNENTAIASSRVTLVPYEARHVEKYHRWMSDPDIQEATASEPMTLQEEYENQASWRSSHDKLTFIICEPLTTNAETVSAGDVDAEERMIGDVNFFLYPYNNDEDEVVTRNEYVGEIDVMVADAGHRGKGVGFGAVTALMEYVHRNVDMILAEFSAGGDQAEEGKPVLRGLMAKINESNEKSVALFKRVGFVQKGSVNYFGELEMVLDGFSQAMEGGKLAWRGEAYREVRYER
ncbi:N-acetyltransferase [Plectosphaerella plurivora]|uniref:N-acetyltransferase n=1 Tax=Plectosphaerella plurivora TaxID=936078 RepID=A0A9P8VEW6_9PEZI|nr:N-acetyltransferase [Plectosphaerella plurivora]